MCNSKPYSRWRTLAKKNLLVIPKYMVNGRNSLCYAHILGKCQGKMCGKAPDGHAPAGKISDAFARDLRGLLSAVVEKGLATEPPLTQGQYSGTYSSKWFNGIMPALHQQQLPDHLRDETAPPPQKRPSWTTDEVRILCPPLHSTAPPPHHGSPASAPAPPMTACQCGLVGFCDPSPSTLHAGPPTALPSHSDAPDDTSASTVIWLPLPRLSCYPSTGACCLHPLTLPMQTLPNSCQACYPHA